MDAKDWIILETLYEVQNITKTAEKLYTSQPAISYRLQQIEDNFGVKLVFRNKKGIKFTSEGEYLVKYAKKMLDELRITKDYLRNLGGTIQGTLRLGVSGSFARHQLSNIMEKFIIQFPYVQVDLKTGYSSEIALLLKNDDVQIGIIKGDYSWNEQTHLLYQEHITIISKHEIDLENLPNLPRIGYRTDTFIKQKIEDWWDQKFTNPPSYVMQVDRVENCKEMVKTGLGYAIIPECCLTQHDNLTTHHLYLEDKPLIRNTFMNYRDKSLELSVVKEFVNFIKHTEILILK